MGYNGGMGMNNLLWGTEPRSTYHNTCVKRVRKYLERKCGKAGSERKLIPGHITDAYGFNKKQKIIYLCEVKVERSDLNRAPKTIYETVLKFKRNHKDYDTVVPVIAVGLRLHKFLVKQDNWESLFNMCKNLSIALWVIEQSTIREVISPKINKIVKTKSSRASTTKKKVTKAKKTVSRKRSAKTSKVRKPTSKKKTTRPKPSTRLKKRVAKSSRAKTLKTQNAKRKISRVKTVKAKATRKKR